jgi:hypothetical protein
MQMKRPVLARVRTFFKIHPKEHGAAAPRRRMTIVLGALFGVFIGALAMWILPLLGHQRGPPPSLPLPARITGSARSARSSAPQLSGDMQTVVRSFSLDDLEGNTVLQVDKLSVFVDLDAMGNGILRMPHGRASHVKLLLRRGSSGRVSLSEAIRGSTEAPGQHTSSNRLDIGPLNVDDVQMTVAMGATAVVIHVNHAQLRVQRTNNELAPRIFLSEIEGYLQKPDPLHQPITIRGGEGVVRLEGGPLVDVRARACLGASELRLRIVVPERHAQTHMTVDAEGALAHAALFALGIAADLKSDKLAVETGSVQVKQPYECSRATGNDARAQMDERAGATRAEASPH